MPLQPKYPIIPIKPPKRVLTLKYDKSQPRKTETMSKGKTIIEASKSTSVNKKSESTIV